MSAHDPLDLFRQSISTALPPVLLTAASEPSPTLSLAAYISFPQSSSAPINIPKDAPTRYTAKAGSGDEFYNLGQVWLAYTERESGVREYLIKGQAGGVGYVSVADRRGVVEFLVGENDGAGRVLAKGADEGESAALVCADCKLMFWWRAQPLWRRRRLPHQLWWSRCHPLWTPLRKPDLRVRRLLSNGNTRWTSPTASSAERWVPARQPFRTG